jgi:RNA polymerase sigma factor (sigma-70 family)
MKMAMPAQSETTSSQVIEQLVQQAAAGDRQAQGLLLMRYRYFIQRAVRERLGQSLRRRESTSDVEQDVALEILRSLKNQQWRGKSAFLGWLRRVVVGEVIDVARYHGAKRRQAKDDVTFSEALAAPVRQSVETWLDERRQLAELERRLDTLPANQAEALVLFHQGHTHAEIGEILGCSPEAARKLVARARAKLAG